MEKQIVSKRIGNSKLISFSYLGAILTFVMPMFITLPAILLGLYYCSPKYDSKTRGHGLKIVIFGILSGILGILVYQDSHHY